MAFKANKIIRASVVDTVYSDLRKRIISGEWKEGEKLPSENEIADAYGVSRVSVRTALQKLIALNIIENRQGDGTYVSKFRFLDFMDNVSDILAQDVSFEEISAFRMIIEEISIRETCKMHHPREDFEKLSSFVDQMGIYVREQDMEGFIRVDYKFHRELCYLSGNKMWAYAYMMMMSVRQNYWSEQISLPNIESKGRTLDEYWLNAEKFHRQILEDVIAGNADSAVEMIHRFIY